MSEAPQEWGGTSLFIMKMMQIKMTPLGSGGARAPPAPPVPTALTCNNKRDEFIKNYKNP